jgi:hypothetical protein
MSMEFSDRPALPRNCGIRESKYEVLVRRSLLIAREIVAILCHLPGSALLF